MTAQQTKKPVAETKYKPARIASFAGILDGLMPNLLLSLAMAGFIVKAPLDPILYL